ncbi:hypothetical protein M5K25_022348 [Dendrobium thyrsiflorum]|uniref:Uncharacterized protein n=1 Tax=Dendrobium thyrsiflorum TaxID=117978 RepID=A0ABD0UC25_DENTH
MAVSENILTGPSSYGVSMDCSAGFLVATGRTGLENEGIGVEIGANSATAKHLGVDHGGFSRKAGGSIATDDDLPPGGESEAATSSGTEQYRARATVDALSLEYKIWIVDLIIPHLDPIAHSHLSY